MIVQHLEHVSVHLELLHVINDEMMSTINETMSQDDKYNKYNNNNMRKRNIKNNANQVAIHNKGGNENKYKTKNKNNIGGRLICLACWYDSELNNRYKNGGNDNAIGAQVNLLKFTRTQPRRVKNSCGFLNFIVNIMWFICIFIRKFQKLLYNSTKFARNFENLRLNGNAMILQLLNHQQKGLSMIMTIMKKKMKMKTNLDLIWK